MKNIIACVLGRERKYESKTAEETVGRSRGGNCKNQWPEEKAPERPRRAAGTDRFTSAGNRFSENQDETRRRVKR